MFKVRFTPESKRLLAEIARRFRPAEVTGFFLRELERESSLAAGAIQRGMSGEFIGVRTGILRRAITGRSIQTDVGPALQVGILSAAGGALDYAGPNEFGTKGLNPDSPYATIVPKRAKALAIPTARAKTRAGVARGAGFGPRDFPGELVFIPFRKGNIVGGLFLKEDVQGDGLGAGAMFLLALQVDLPERGYLKFGFERYQPGLVSRLEVSMARWLATGQQR